MLSFHQHHWPHLFFMNTQDFSYYYIKTWYTKFGMKSLVSNTFLKYEYLNIMPTVFANQWQNIMSWSGYKIKFSANRNIDIYSRLRLPKKSRIIGSCHKFFYMFFEMTNFWANLQLNFLNFLSAFLTIIRDVPRGILVSRALNCSFLYLFFFYKFFFTHISSKM